MLYDGECPLCSREAAWLMRKDTSGRLAFEDISKPDFDPGKYGLSRAEVNREIHGVLADGTVIRRVEVFRRIYAAIGLGWLLAPTKLPGIKQLADLGYLFFAKNRIRIGKIVGRVCGDGKCKV